MITFNNNTISQQFDWFFERNHNRANYAIERETSPNATFQEPNHYLKAITELSQQHNHTMHLNEPLQGQKVSQRAATTKGRGDCRINIWSPAGAPFVIQYLSRLAIAFRKENDVVINFAGLRRFRRPSFVAQFA